MYRILAIVLAISFSTFADEKPFSAARFEGEALKQIRIVASSGLTSQEDQYSAQLKFDAPLGKGQVKISGFHWTCDFNFTMNNSELDRLKADLEKIKICKDNWPGADDGGDHIVNLTYGRRELQVRAYDGDSPIEHFFCKKGMVKPLMERLKGTAIPEAIKRCQKDRLKMIESVFWYPQY